QWAAGLGRRADQSLADFQSQRARDLGWITDGIGDGQLVALRVEQVDRKRLEVRQLRDELRDLLQELLEIENRRDFAAQRKKRGQRLDSACADIRFRCSGRLCHVWPKDVCKYNRLFTWT